MEPAATRPKPPEPALRAALNAPTTQHCVGKWLGLWDGKWAVQFTVTQDPNDPSQLNALYEWEERRDQPMRQSSRPATIDGDVLRVGDAIEITFSPTNPNQATAVGHFRTPRTAQLTRKTVVE